MGFGSKLPKQRKCGWRNDLTPMNADERRWQELAPSLRSGRTLLPNKGMA